MGTEKTISFRGYVKHQNGNAIKNISVVLNEKLLRKKKKFFDVTTNTEGYYEFDVDSLSDKTSFTIDVVGKDKKILGSSETIYDVRKSNAVNFTIDGPLYKGACQYDNSKKLYDEFYVELKESSKEFKLTLEDVNYIATKTNSDPKETLYWLRANELAEKIKLPSEVFYGLFKQGLPTNMEALFVHDGKAIKETIKKAVNENHIPKKYGKSAARIEIQWNEMIVEKTLDSKLGLTDSSFNDLLKLVIKDRDEQKKVLLLHLSHNGTNDSFWESLKSVTDEKTVGYIKDLFKLSALTGNNIPLISKYVKKKSVKGNLLHELAANSKSDWEKILSKPKGEKGFIIPPYFMPDEKEKVRLSQYIDQIIKTLENSYPTEAFLGKLKRSPLIKDETKKKDILKFFKNNPTYEMSKNASILKDKDTPFDFTGIKGKESLIKDLQSIQRLTSYSKDFNVIAILMSHKLDSASAILDIPKRQFVNKYGKIFRSNELAGRVYEKAANNYMQANMLWARSHSTDFSSNITENADLRTMFGTLDSCECKHCASVFSPAAYYTDILNFLYKLTPGIYENLIARRPDLENIELSCHNANTALPYIDLVNELLENTVAAQSGIPTISEYQTTLNADELAANPEYLNYEVYEELKKTVYPSVLPFNLSLEEVRTYLKHLKMKKEDLMTLFYSGTENGSVDDFYINMERLNISPEEADILSGDTSNSWEQWNFYGFNKEKGFTPLIDPADSSKRISGGKGDQLIRWNLILTGRVDLFLQQTMLTYKELLAILNCKFINPDPEAKIDIKSIDGDNSSCNLSNLKLEGITSHLDKLHRFVRLWRKLGWSIYDLDKAIIALKDADTGFNKTALIRISQVDFLAKYLNISIDEVLVFWSDISDTKYEDYLDSDEGSVTSLYDKLFKNKSVQNPVEETFVDYGNLSGNLDDVSTTLIAAFEINHEDYLHYKSLLNNDSLNIKNISILYRNSLLAKKLKITSQEYLLYRTVINITDIFNSPKDTINFITNVSNIKKSGFNIEDLCYILRNDPVSGAGIEPDDERINNFREKLKSAMSSENTIVEDVIIQNFSEELSISVKSVEELLSECEIEILSNSTNSDLNINDDVNISEPLIELSKFKESYNKLDKIATVIKKLKLSDSDIKNLLDHWESIGCLNIANLPVSETDSTIAYSEFEILLQLIEARDLIPHGTSDFFNIVLSAVNAEPSKEMWVKNIVERTNWNRDTLVGLIGAEDENGSAGILEVSFPQDFKNGSIILKLGRCFSIIDQLGVSTDLIEGIIAKDVTGATACSLKNAVKSKYDNEKWLKLAKPLRDELREKQRNALVNYIIANFGESLGCKDSNELYEYFLIDVEMKPISMTSRIKQAICSVQLFIDRVLMNLEYPLQMDSSQVEEWKEWRKIYRVWEANRKIFLYPENWIEPELRDDKSPFFKSLESKLKQNELSENFVEDAFHGYLEKLDEVGRLEIIGFYHELDEDSKRYDTPIDRLHVFGRTYANPHIYFHRYKEYGEWTSWNKIETDIDGDHIVPIMLNGKLCLFWYFFTPQSESTKTNNSTDGNSEETEVVNHWWKIQVAWCELKNRTWSAKKISESFLESDKFETKDELNKFKGNIRVNAFNRNEKVDVVGIKEAGSVELVQKMYSVKNYKILDSVFVFNNTNTEPVIINTDRSNTDNYFPICDKWERKNVKDSVTHRQMIKSKIENQSLIYYTNTYTKRQGWVGNEEVVLGGSNGFFHIVQPANIPDMTLNDYFYQDDINVFYAYHKKEVVPTLELIDVGISGWFSIVDKIWGSRLSQNTIAGTSIGDNNIKDDIDLIFDSMGQGDNLINNTSENFGNGYQHKSLSKPVSSHDVNILTENKKGAVIEKIGKGAFGNPQFVDAITEKFKIVDKFYFQTFYHPHVKEFINLLYRNGIKGLLKRSVQEIGSKIDFKNSYKPEDLISKPYPQGAVDFSYGSAYGQYNWELFFHVPMLIACRLKDDQRFEEARKWFHFIFDPTSGDGGGKERFWQFKEFYDEAGREIQTLNELLKNEAQLSEQIDKWQRDPFKPHVIARIRISAYMKNVVMKYLDNLISWADNLFSRDSIESINEATNLYILAAKLLGERPKEIPPRSSKKVNKFSDFKVEEGNPNSLDSFSNSLVDIETMISPSTSGGKNSGTATALGKMFYYCVPGNEKILQYWDTIADRLFKIRNSMNIEGAHRTLPLFQPPIDPALLVKATAHGVDLNKVLGDINSKLPNYRFSFMLQKTNEFVAELKSMGSSLLQVLEKKDAEKLALIRSAHEQKLLDATLAIREEQKEHAKRILESTKKSKEIVEKKYDYYSSRERVNFGEQLQLDSIQNGIIISTLQGMSNYMGGVLSMVPDTKAGPPTTVGATWGGSNLGAMMKSISSYLGIIAAINNAEGTMGGIIGGYKRREEGWKFQAETADFEKKQLDKQIIASEIQLAIAEKELLNHKLQIENIKESDEFMRTKFTNDELYDWMVGQVSTIYFQTYHMALELARKTQECYKHELGEYDSIGFTEPRYWDNLKKGLLSGEKLQYDLRRMENAFYENNRREFELTKNISLLMLDPGAILDIRDKGSADFEIPEEIFDLDYPGHYFRRIKSVSVSIPCVAGPYTTVNAKLKLNKNKIRIIDSCYDAGDDAENYPIKENDTRFKIFEGCNKSLIATSHGQNDSGMFELNFNDPRYLPFEGMGAISSWELELNTEKSLRTFDYNTISDIIVTIKYTARESENLKCEAQDYLKSLINKATDEERKLRFSRLFSLKHEFSNEWLDFINSPSDSKKKINIKLTKEQFPYFAQDKKIVINGIELKGIEDDNFKLIINSNKLSKSSKKGKVNLENSDNVSVDNTEINIELLKSYSGDDLALIINYGCECLESE